MLINLLIIFLQVLYQHIECFKLVNFNNSAQLSRSDTYNVYKSKNYQNVNYSPNEERLLKYLFTNYNPNIIPIESSNQSLKLFIGMAMIQLINIVKPAFS
jgi:hypothetical protein